MSAWEFPEVPFKRVHEELMEFQNQYFGMEHIIREVNCLGFRHKSLGFRQLWTRNILWELAKRTDHKKIKALETEKSQLATHVATMTQELT